MKLSTVASVVHGAGSGGSIPDRRALLRTGRRVVRLRFRPVQAEKTHRLSRFLFVERDAKAFPSVRAGVSQGVRIGEAINWGRVLVATPPAELRPTTLLAPPGGWPAGSEAPRLARCASVSSSPGTFRLKAGGSLPWRRGATPRRA